jgi:hypothetical protein
VSDPLALLPVIAVRLAAERGCVSAPCIGAYPEPVILRYVTAAKPLERL